MPLCIRSTTQANLRPGIRPGVQPGIRSDIGSGVRPGIRSAWRRQVGWGSILVGVGVLWGCDPIMPEGAVVTPTIVFGESGDRLGQFFYPRAMDSDRDGNIWVIDKTARVQGFDAQTGEPFVQWRLPNYEKGKPTGLTIGPGDDGQEVLYVADTHYHRVLVYSLPTEAGQSAELLGSFGSIGVEPGQFIYPTDVAVLADAETGKPTRIYVSEYGGNDRISVFDADYQFLFAFGSPDADPDAAGEIVFNRPQSMVIDADARELIVTDSSNHRVGRFTLDGEIIAWVGGFGTEAGAFCYPYGLALLGDGTALVSEFGNHRIQRIDLATGSSRGVYGKPGADDGELQNPWAVTTIDQTAYILDSGNNRIIGFRRP